MKNKTNTLYKIPFSIAKRKLKTWKSEITFHRLLKGSHQWWDFFSLKKKDLREGDLEEGIVQTFVNAIKSSKLRGDKF